MKLGIALPNMLPYGLDRRLLLSWMRLADEAGFHAVSVLDRPNYDAWDPLPVLAAAAAVTERVRLATSVLVLPIRNEVEIAKQAAVIDRLSGGRVDLGVGVGARADDYEVMGAPFAQRGPRLARQVARMRELWATAATSDASTGHVGPAPLQEGGIPILVGAADDRAVERALRIGDGFFFGGGLPAAAVLAQLPGLRERAAALGKPGFRFLKIQYCGVGDPDVVLEEARSHLLRYYRNPMMPFDRMVVRGGTEVLVEHARSLADAGLDELIYLPQVLDLRQVELIARDVLPAYL